MCYTGIQSTNAGTDSLEIDCFKAYELLSYPSFDAGADGVYAQVPGVVVGDVDLGELRVWVPLQCAVKQAMVDGHPDAPLSSQFCFDRSQD